jgi:hypothetical protein
MLAGTLAKAGYFMGNSLYPPRSSNPKGFYEDKEINDINEALIAPAISARPEFLPSRLRKLVFRERPLQGQRWLARVPVGTELLAPPEITGRIDEMTRQEPFCFKDPRFCYTLPAWRPFLRNTVFLCVFRDPASTALSILRETREAPNLRTFSISLEQALEVWRLMYLHILQTHFHEGSWLFLHYNQVLADPGLDRLEAFVEAPADRSFPDPSLRHSVSEAPVPLEVRHVYQQLCRLADYGES